MILVDTSAWIEFFRRKGDADYKLKVRDLLASNTAVYTCSIRFELICGARAEEMDDLLNGLELAQRRILLPMDWDAAAEAARKVNSAGLRIPASDLLIATVAEREKMPILTKDQHFAVLQRKFLPKLQMADC